MLVTADTLDRVAFSDAESLLPAIAQDRASGEIRMVAWMNRAALEATLSRGRAVFYSRRRRTLWEKGETSGHTLEVHAVHVDCDADCLLLHVTAHGPTCHTGADNCFVVPPPPAASIAFLSELETRIEARLADGAEDSYTARLARAGVARIAQKVGEEGVEVALAGAAGDPSALVNESADLLYHLLVLLRQRGSSLAVVVAELARRSRPNP